MSIRNEEIVSILQAFDQSNSNSLRLTIGGVELVASKFAHKAAVPKEGEVCGAVAPPASRQALVRAPHLGIVRFHEQGGSGQFVSEGATFGAGAILCEIEAMGRLTKVKSMSSGRVLERLMNDGDLVEYETPLYAIDED